MIAPALAPATFFHVLMGLVGCSANPHSAPARPSPLTPPPRKTPSASVIQSTPAPLITRPASNTRQPQIVDEEPGTGRSILLLLSPCYHARAANAMAAHSRGSFKPSADSTAISARTPTPSASTRQGCS